MGYGPMADAYRLPATALVAGGGGLGMFRRLSCSGSGRSAQCAVGRLGASWHWHWRVLASWRIGILWPQELQAATVISGKGGDARNARQTRPRAI
eukprot:scaffold42685_cov281-Isochrysis_galbana.AAC.2